MRAGEALSDLLDALLTAGAVPSPVHLSLAPVHRRGWGSLYAALARGEVPVAAVAQARSSPAARTYLARRESEGKTRREAIRALKRFLVRAIWRLWQACASETPAHPADLGSAAA